MTKLNQIIAVEQGVKSRANRDLTDLHHRVQKEVLLSGLSRTYDPRDDDGDKLPPEGTRVQVKAEDALTATGTILTRLFDVIATKDEANRTASADVVVDGTPLLTDVPVTYLLFLEKQLFDIHTFVAKIPTLNPAETWHYDTGLGVFATDPVKTVRTKKVPRVLTMAAATKEHPAQTTVYQEDVPEGEWSTVKFSGALPADRQKALLERIVKLTEAVKVAREVANQAEVQDKKVGEAVFGYLFA